MWDTVQASSDHLSHDRPCGRCGHPMHFFLACGEGCDCERMTPPSVSRTAGLAAH